MERCMAGQLNGLIQLTPCKGFLWVLPSSKITYDARQRKLTALNKVQDFQGLPVTTKN